MGILDFLGLGDTGEAFPPNDIRNLTQQGGPLARFRNQIPQPDPMQTGAGPDQGPFEAIRQRLGIPNERPYGGMVPDNAMMERLYQLLGGGGSGGPSSSQGLGAASPAGAAVPAPGPAPLQRSAQPYLPGRTRMPFDFPLTGGGGGQPVRRMDLATRQLTPQPTGQGLGAAIAAAQLPDRLWEERRRKRRGY